jgi:hypothetical protein
LVRPLRSPRSLGGCRLLGSSKTVSPLRRVLQQPPAMQEQKIRVLSRLDLVQFQCFLQGVLRVCAAHVEPLHLRVASAKLAHVVANYMKLGFKGASRATTTGDMLVEVHRDPLPERVLPLSIPHTRILRNVQEAPAQLTLLLGCEIAPLLGLRRCRSRGERRGTCCRRERCSLRRSSPTSRHPSRKGAKPKKIRFDQLSSAV